MTREETIKRLKEVRTTIQPYRYVDEAIDMAIEALEQEQCDDAISRQAVLDGIEELKKSPWATDKRGNGFEYLITEALDTVAFLCVKQEPSVIPKSETVTEFADRCRECGAKYGKLLESKTGRWINKQHLFDSCSAECSSCHKISDGYMHDNGFSLECKYYDFCPNCGARMESEEE